MFARLKPQSLEFALAVALRSLCMATFPLVPDAFWQVFLEQCTIAVYSACAFHYQPWRASINNVVDIGSGAVFMVILHCAGSSLPEGSADPKGFGILVVIAVTTVCASSCALLIGSLIMHVVPKGKRFLFFLCHQKASSGALARLLNLALSDVAEGREVFLDADHLSRLDMLFGYVKDDTSTLVVLLTPQLLRSAWCLGEITTAFKHDVVTLPVYLLDFERPSQSFIDRITETVNFTVLSENCIISSDVKDAVSHLLGLTHIDARGRLSLEGSAVARGGFSRGGFWIWLKIGRFRDLGEAPHFFGWF